MIIEHFEDSLKLAKAFLEAKKRDNYFDFQLELQWLWWKKC